jgi:TPR repeat protein
MIKLLRTAAFLLCTAIAIPAMAQDYDKGLAAAQAGGYATALQEWRPLAEQGHASAQRNLGIMYFEGNGVIQDYAEALDWTRLAAEQGYASAQHNLGIMYANGDGVIQDYAEALDWARLAAEQGNANAQYSLGIMYFEGNGVIQDAVIAHMWINISGANGYTRSSDARDMVEERMTREQIAEAQSLARRCMDSNYQNCG